MPVCHGAGPNLQKSRSSALLEDSSLRRLAPKSQTKYKEPRNQSADTSSIAHPLRTAVPADHGTGLDLQKPNSTALRLPRKLNVNLDSLQLPQQPLAHTRTHVTQPRTLLPLRRPQAMIQGLIYNTMILRTPPPVQPQRTFESFLLPGHCRRHVKDRASLV